MIRFIEKIRAGDRRTKLKWLIIFSSVSMVLVVILWIAALNVITFNILNPEVPAAATGEPTTSLGDQFGSMFRELQTRTTNAFSNLKSSIAGREVELNQPSN